MPSDLAVEFLTNTGRLCTEQADDVRSLMVAVHAALAPPRSPADLDNRMLLAAVRSEDRQLLWSRIAVAHMHLAVHAGDHVRALGLALSDPQVEVPVYAHASLARAAVESASLVLYLLADNDPFEVRLARGIAMLIVDAGEAAKAADQVPGNPYMSEPGPAVTAQKDRLVKLIDQAQVHHVTASSLAKKHFGDLPAVYSLLSGIVHGLPWGLTDNASIEGREMRWQPDAMQIGGSVLAATAAASRIGAGFAAYRGFPDHPLVERLAGRAVKADQLLSRFGQQSGALAGARPTITGMIQRSQSRRATSA